MLIIRPTENWTSGPAYAGGETLKTSHIYKALRATNQPDHIEQGKIFVNDILLVSGEYTIIRED